MSEASPSADTGRIKHLKLRFTFSALCGIICLQLICLWFRSYWWHETVSWSTASLEVESARGLFSVAILKPGTGATSYHSKIKATDRSVRKQWKLIWEHRRYGALFPYWFLVLLFGGLAASPWTRRPKLRFSLRDLLIGMALIAALLGAVVWAAK